jgi:2-keto-3-deoxy-L-rhamnonate aldolase RhmA
MFQKAGAILCSLLSIPFGIPAVLAQTTGSTPALAQAPPQLLTADQLDTLVAPVALYPDPLLSQVLAASTYPLEVVEAEQWLQQNQNLHGQHLMDAAKRQNWDPSVQALVAFPTALNLLNSDISWTTDLGNAFLAKQADVMASIQRMRARAQANGKLASTPQQVVTTQTQGRQNAVVIQPANPRT